MALIKQMYDLTKYVNKTEDKDNFLIYKETDKQAWKQYAEVAGIPEKEATNIGRAAMKQQYLTYAPLHEPSDPNGVLRIIIAPDGVDLLDRNFLGISSGLFRAWMNANRVLASLLWILIGLILGNVSTICHFIGKL